ncbi:SusC/RagA family TonB-linked outer membrane protein [Halalkalibaculum sp. DA3122]|uniref:SusC/RagA family TonB-linked outer membrane protein n=1 Tax=unclassified Halalkalibaculum TaxID=2964617 RepID=UPI0037550A30
MNMIPYKWTGIVSLMVLLLAVALPAEAQDSKDVYVSSSDINAATVKTFQQGTSLHAVLSEIEERYEVKFFYRSELMADKTLTEQQILYFEKDLFSLLDSLLPGFGFTYKVLTHRTLGILPAKPVPSEKINLEVVSGTVADANTGETLPGVNVLVKGTTTGASTDSEGRFELGVPSLQDTLVVSFIGYQTAEVPIGGRTEMEIALQPQAIEGEELVVTGYGIQKKSDVTGSIGMVSEEDLQEQPTFNALQGLRGKVAGVNIFTNSGAPTGSNRVVIRGTGSINAGIEPLYVVDGVVMQDGIEYMNPNNIESIEVLKDASATAIYGSRGANGVILVTTKRGDTQSDEVSVSYDGTFSMGHMLGRMDAMNAEEFMEVQRTGYENAPLFDDYAPGEEPELDLSPDIGTLFDEQGNPIYDTDWQEEVTRTALSHDHQIGIQSGGENSSFGGFLNYTNNEGIILNSWMRRASAKIVYDANPTDWLTLGTNLTVTRTWENNIEEGGGGQEIRRTMIEFAPILPVRMPDGDWSHFSDVRSLTLEGQPNPVHRALEEDRLRDRVNLFGNTFAEFQITPNLEFRTQFGIDNTNFEARDYDPTDLYSPETSVGNASMSNSETTYWQNENYLTYLLDQGPHSVNAVLGASWQQTTYRSNSFGVRNFPNDLYRTNNVDAATEVEGIPASDAWEWTMNSFFARGSYTYDSRYSATFTSRMDGSSRFGENNKYGFFPSLGLGWTASNEEFMSDVDFINHLKIRGSWGKTGNTEIGVYQSLSTISSGTVLLGNQRQTSSTLQRMANPDLEWEKTTQYNIGLEMDVLQNAITFEADYYYKDTEDLLLNRPIPSTTGFDVVLDNIGSVSNQGVDFMMTTRNVRSNDFFWETTLNFNYNVNRVESLGAEDEDIFPGPNWVSGSQTILRVGEPIGTFYGFQRFGTWNTDEAAEAAARGRIPGEAKRSEDRQIIGHGMPDWTGSFINRFSYKNFDFTADIQFVYGSEIMQQFLHTAEDRQALTNGIATQLYEAWTVDNQDTPIQRIRHQPLSGQNTQADSHWIVDGSYIRGNLFSVGYNLDQNLISRFGIQDMRVTASVQNAFVIHHPDFKGHDPEGSSWQGNPNTQNIFFYQYPKPRTFTLGVNFRF